MIHGNLFERPDKIINKLTKMGLRNPRYVTAVREAANEKMKLKDLAGDYKILSKAQIKREYSQERIEDLLARARKNIKNMTDPGIRPGWMPTE